MSGLWKDQKVDIPSIDKDTHASSGLIPAGSCVIVNRRTSSTPHSASLNLPELGLLEVGESGSGCFGVLQGA